jgi:hypothetical protein
MYSDKVPLAGARVLAFVHDDCVGSGLVEVFRTDLLAAGIGDGVAGFSFPIYLKPSHDQRVLDVRLDGSNALIGQAGACLISRDEIGAEQRRKPRDPLSLSWMLARGWLTQEQYEALRLLGQFGAYSHRLRFSSDDPTDPGRWQEVAEVAGAMLQLHMHIDVTPVARTDVRGDELPDLRGHLHAEFPAVAPVIGLWAPCTSCLNVVEGSHLHARTDSASGGIDYEFGDDRLLWINLDTAISVPTGGLTSTAIAFIPSRTQ